LRIIRISAVVSLAMVVFGQHTAAQSLTFSLFERYLESLRDQAAIPGLSAAIVQDGAVVWEGGFGFANVERFVRPDGQTPYPVADLSQTISSTLLLQQCVDHGTLRINDFVRRWITGYPEPETTVAHLLAHAAPSGGFRYDTSRFASLTTVVDQCTSSRLPVKVVGEIFDFLSMTDTVPGEDLGDASSPNRRYFTADRVARYASVLQRVATPYRVDSRGKPSRAEHAAHTLSAASGVVSTVRDLARFDAALDRGDLLDEPTLRLARTRAASSLPTGLGWFVQGYNNEMLVWHFGLAKDAYSSLLLKIPSRRLTLILLANSDGLSAPYSLDKGDVTASAFAKVFLRLFVP
jgi:CubicO group peptidase (beta-lactamase class C family)